MVQWFCFTSLRLFDEWMYSDDESVWHNLWSQNKYRSWRPIFHRFCLISGRLFDGWTSYFRIMIQTMWCDLWPKNRCRSHLLLTIQYFFHISLKQLDGWTSYIGVIGQTDEAWPNKWRSMWPILHGSVILPYFLKAIWWGLWVVWLKNYLIINVNHSDMVQWFWRGFHGWT